jgi:hypothetical protein
LGHIKGHTHSGIESQKENGQALKGEGVKQGGGKILKLSGYIPISMCITI